MCPSIPDTWKRSIFFWNSWNAIRCFDILGRSDEEKKSQLKHKILDWRESFFKKIMKCKHSHISSLFSSICFLLQKKILSSMSISYLTWQTKIRNYACKCESIEKKFLEAFRNETCKVGYIWFKTKRTAYRSSARKSQCSTEWNTIRENLVYG